MGNSESGNFHPPGTTQTEVARPPTVRYDDRTEQAVKPSEGQVLSVYQPRDEFSEKSETEPKQREYSSDRIPESLEQTLRSATTELRHIIRQLHL